jgi:uncharacterized membrane protein YkvI
MKKNRTIVAVVDSAHKRDGYFVLLGVIVAGMIVAVLAFTLITLSSSASDSSFTLVQSEQARALANACAEKGIEQLIASTTFTGANNFSLGQGTCSYGISVASGTVRFIAASGTVATVTRRADVMLDIATFVSGQNVNPSSWQEVAN